MNGIHDMGGMQDMGPIENEKNEPVFHARWEARVAAIGKALGATGRLKGGLRPPIENLPPLDYLRMSYYEKRLVSLVERMLAGGLVTRAELDSGSPAAGSAKSAPALKAADVAAFMRQVPKLLNDNTAARRFQIGQAVRARNINPVTHTRMPRYVRGKSGVIERDRGVAALPDTSVYGQGDKPQHVYSVRFAAREVWGAGAAAQDSVHIDLWEDYLEPA
jgi:nitrile hydratase subunit beta